MGDEQKPSTGRASGLGNAPGFRYNTVRTIVIADVLGTIGVFTGLGFANFFVGPRYILEVALPTAAFTFILLPILLLIYNVIANRRKCASTTP